MSFGGEKRHPKRHPILDGCRRRPTGEPAVYRHDDARQKVQSTTRGCVMVEKIVQLLRDDIDRLPTESTRYEVSVTDPSGTRVRWLFIRVNPSGTKDFVLRYRDDAGKRHVVTIGRFVARAFDPAAILEKHDGWVADPGTRPTAESNRVARVARKKAAKRAASRPTVASLAKVYLAVIEDPQGGNFLKSHMEVGRYFRRYIKPRFGTLVAEDLTAASVTKRLEDIRASHGDRTADLSHAYLSAMLTWGTRLPTDNRLRIRFNPMRDIPRVGVPKSPDATATRDLKLSEIPVFWHGVDADFQPTYKKDSKRGAGSPTGERRRVMRREFAIGLRLLLQLGVRRQELTAAKWSEFDLKKAEWDCPGSRTKTGKSLVQPLPTQAVELLEELHRLTGPGTFLFPKHEDPTEPIRPETLTHALRKARDRGAFGDIPNFTVHDLRRTLRTHITRTGCDRDTAERILNHQVGSRVERVYDRYDHMEEKRLALQAWADAIDELVGDTAQVIELNR